MANTFKVKTKAGIGTSITTVYTVPSSTTTIVLGLIVGNVTGSAVNATVHVESDTSDTETNGNVELVTNAPIPAGGSLETLGGGKLYYKRLTYYRTSDTASSLDVALSIMEIHKMAATIPTNGIVLNSGSNVADGDYTGQWSRYKFWLLQITSAKLLMTMKKAHDIVVKPNEMLYFETDYNLYKLWRQFRYF